MKSLTATLSFLGLLVASVNIAAQQPSGLKEDRIEEVVVYGTKQDLSVQDAAVSVVVLSSDDLDENAVYQLNDLFLRTPNVTLGLPETLTIRGISRTGVGFAGQGVTSNIYQDGVPKAGVALGQDAGSVWDIEQVEILRGPQSTIQGRNALAGSVVITTSDPVYDWEVLGRVRGSEYGNNQYAGVLSGPIIEDQLAFRFSADLQQSDGFIDNGVTGERGIDGFDILTLRSKLLVEPSAIEKLRTELIYEYTDSDRGANAPFVFAPVRADNPAYLDFDPTDRVSFGRTTEADIEIHRYVADLSYELSDRYTLHGLLTYEDVDSVFLTGSLENLAEFGLFESFASDTKTASAELRLEFNFDSVSGFVGAYYFSEEVDGFSTFATTFVSQVPFPARPADTIVTGTQPIGSDVENYALYGQVRWDISEDWILDLGLRYDYEEFQTIGVGTSGTAVDPPSCETDVPGFLVGAPVDFVTIPCQTLVNIVAPTVENPLQVNDFNAVLPRATITYVVSDAVSLFASYQRGYRAGGSFLQASASGTIIGTYDPEYLSNFEVGFRSQFFDDRLTVNGNFFYSELEDQQVSIPGPSGQDRDFSVANVGETEITGAELSLTYQVREGLSVYADIGLLDAEFVDFPYSSAGLPFENLAGNALPGAPDFSASMGAIYQHGNGLFASMNVSYQSETESSANVEGLTEADLVPGVDESLGSRMLVNGRLGFERDSWTVYAFVQNAFDEDALVYSNVANVIPQTGEVSYIALPFLSNQTPRVFGAGVDFSL